MNTFHVFADMSKLPVQEEDFSFGPKSSDEFRLTSGFCIDEDVKAYAVVPGFVLLQEVNTTDDPDGKLVNLILKPFLQPKINFASVKYFIYRGLKKSDFEEMTINK